MIDSGCRPDLLKRTVDSLIEHLKFSGNLNWIHHEAHLNSQGAECLNYVNSLKMFSRVIETHDPKGECVSIYTVLKALHPDTKYFIHWEDDHILTRPLDLDLCYSLFESYNQINQIAFNKRQTMSDVSGWVKKEVKFGDTILTTSPHWRFSPAVWRLSFIRPYFKPHEGPNGHWVLNGEMQKDFQPGKTANHVIERMGTYYLGPIGEHGYVEHIGRGRSGRIEGK
jgi:hypothetical protein